MPTLTLVENTFVSLVRANDYIDQSARMATPWLFLGTDERVRALISSYRELEKLTWLGTVATVEYVGVVGNLVIAAAGTGYVVGDIITSSGGTGTAIQLKVATVGGGGDVLTFTIEETGGFTTSPTNDVSFTGGTGSAFEATITFKTQTSFFPRTGITDRYEIAVSGTEVPTAVENAQIELAFDISQDTTIESGTGTSSNVKSVKAGSAEAEFFKPVDGVRLTQGSFDLIKEFLVGPTGAAGSCAFGTDGLSQFDDADALAKTLGFP